MQKQLIRVLLAASAGAAVLPAIAMDAACNAPGPNQSLQLGGCMAGDRLILREINFDTGTATLLPTSTVFLQQVAQELRTNDSLKVGIQGHTDSRGDAAYNMALSHSRAAAVRDYLIAAGVNPEQLEAQGFGETSPMADNNSAEGLALNRRVELMIIGTLAPATAPAEPPPPQDVYISTFSAQPDSLTVPVGTTVNWHNYDEISHDVTFSDQPTDRIWTQPWKGSTVSRTFEQPGVYNYQCSVHKDVNGSITVAAPVKVITETESPAYAGQTTTSYKAAQTSKPYSGGTAPAAMPMHGNRATTAATPMYPATAPVKQSVAASPMGSEVGIKSHAFSPKRLVVTPGTVVKWTNNEKSKHMVVFGTEQSDVLQQGSTFEKRFDEPGEYNYHCGFHGYMEGTIIVNGG